MIRPTTPEHREHRRALAHLRKKRERDRISKPVKKPYDTEPRSAQPCECVRPIPVEGECFKCQRAVMPVVSLTKERYADL